MPVCILERLGIVVGFRPSQSRRSLSVSIGHVGRSRTRHVVTPESGITVARGISFGHFGHRFASPIILVLRGTAMNSSYAPSPRSSLDRVVSCCVHYVICWHTATALIRQPDIYSIQCWQLAVPSI